MSALDAIGGAAGPEAGTALVRYVEQVRDRKLAEIRARAALECRTLLNAARQRAREQVRRALQEARQDADAHINLAQAGAQGRLRRARHARTSAAVEGVWERIVAAVRQRWDLPAARRAWVAMALAEAARHLPGGTWVVSLPAASVRTECDAEFRTLIEGRPDVVLEIRPQAGLEAGLRVACGAAVLDASGAGLLRGRARVEGQWLAALARRQGAL